MDAISSIASITPAPTGSGVSAPAVRQNSERAVQAAARLFNMRDEDVHKLLQQGSSLADIAKDKNVDQNQLVSAVKQAFKSGGSRLDHETSNDIAKAVVSHKNRPRENKK